MSNRFPTRAVIVSLLGLAGMSLGCDRSPAGPTPTAVPQPATPVSVTSITPTGGPAGAVVIVAGTGFQQGTTVTLGGIAARVTGVTSTAITATTPVHEGGTVDVVVTNPSGQSGTLNGGYTFEVVTVTASSILAAPGGQLSVSWVAPSGRRLDWIGLFKVGDPNTSYENGWWAYTDGAPSGTLTLTAPAQPGQYEFRYLLDDGFLDVARSSRVTVSASAAR